MTCTCWRSSSIAASVVRSTNDVAKFLEVTHQPFPNPPPGKKLFLNPATRRFELVDQ